MNTEELNKMINEYFDNELSKEKEVFLFSQLSQNEEARNYFKNVNLLNSAIQETSNEFPDELEQKILHGIKNKPERKNFIFINKNFFAVASYALSVILIIISVYFFNQSSNYKERVENTMSYISSQNEKIDLLMSTIPAVQVSPEYQNEVTINSQL